MEISLEHGYHGHYVLIRSEGIPCSNYFFKVLEQNKIPGLLSVEKRYTEGDVVYAYEITGKESFKKFLRVCPLCYQDIKRILLQLMEIVEKSEEYLLNSDKLLLEIDSIYLDEDRMTFCYYPEKQTGFYESFRVFVEQLLKAVDHKDINGTVFLYELYDACQSDTFVLKNYLKESWQRENPVQEKESSANIVEAVPQMRLSKKHGLQFLFNRAKRKKKEQIREEHWVEVWKLKGNQELVVDKFPFIIGKQADKTDGVLNSVHVSRLHARIEKEQGLLYLTDLNSTNGTFLNGRRIPNGKKELLSPGDRISFADEVFLFVKEV